MDGCGKHRHKAGVIPYDQNGAKPKAAVPPALAPPQVETLLPRPAVTPPSVKPRAVETLVVIAVLPGVPETVVLLAEPVTTTAPPAATPPDLPTWVLKPMPALEVADDATAVPAGLAKAGEMANSSAAAMAMEKTRIYFFFQNVRPS